MKFQPWLVLLCLFACSPQGKPPVLPAPKGPVMGVGSRSAVHKTPPESRLIAVDAQGQRAAPRISDGAAGGVTSNDWWSSLIYPQDKSSVESLPLYAHPLVVQTHALGFGVSYPNEPKVAEREYMFRHDEDFVIGLEGWSATALSVTRHSDFDVSAELKGEAGSLNATFGHGLPYVQLTRAPGAADAVIVFAAGGQVALKKTEGTTAVFASGSRLYAAFAPAGSWEPTKGGLKSDLGGRQHFAVAALPDDRPDTLRLFEEHAFAFVKETEVTWSRSGGVIKTMYSARTEVVEPCPSEGSSADVPRSTSEDAAAAKPTARGAGSSCTRAGEALLALYPHQWANTTSALLPQTFVSPRGAMKVSKEGRFQTKLTAQGLLPVLPIAPSEESKVRGWLMKETRGELFPLGLGENPDYDAYWDGKSMGRVSTLAHIAQELGETKVRDRLVAALKARLSDWFDGKAPRYFYYDETWRSLMAFPDSYGSASHLNDHHFHYGYFIHAAATVAYFDQTWARENQEMVELLIRDVASPDSEDPLFPRLRHMDLYAGHSWANGPAQFYEGNNEESSSEDINFSYALALWGALTENKKYEDLGLYLYATQASAVQEYWFDVHERVFPSNFEHPTIAMVWGAGGKYDTWFDQDPGIIHGINFLPFTGGSLYLGLHPKYVRENFQTILERSYGEITTWRDPILMFAALGDPDEALRHFNQDRLFTTEFGASRAMTHLWLTSLAHFGLPQFSEAPPSPYAITFKKNNQPTRVAFDPQTRKMTVD